MRKKVLKRSGVAVDFDRTILERSLRRAGASDTLARQIAESIGESISEGDSTDMIYTRAFALLSEDTKNVAMRYSLKKALFGFGPTGFPFEKFVAELFRRRGYTVSTNVHLRGCCISHEVDVCATAPERIAMEVKFHNDMRTRSDVKAVLYIKARFDDLTGRTRHRAVRRGAVDQCILVTNTKFTKSAITYATCAGVSLFGWGYPYRKNLQTYINEVGAHPITCLPSVSTSVLRELFGKGIVTCRGLLEHKEVLRSLKNADEIVADADSICINPIKVGSSLSVPVTGR